MNSPKRIWIHTVQKHSFTTNVRGTTRDSEKSIEYIRASLFQSEDFLKSQGLMKIPEPKKVAWCNTTKCSNWEEVDKPGDKMRVPGNCACSDENPNYYLDCDFYS